MTETDKQLFRASTTVTVGNGRTAKFWGGYMAKWAGAKRHCTETVQASVEETPDSSGADGKHEMD